MGKSLALRFAHFLFTYLIANKNGICSVVLEKPILLCEIYLMNKLTYLATRFRIILANLEKSGIKKYKHRDGSVANIKEMDRENRPL